MPLEYEHRVKEMIEDIVVHHSRTGGELTPARARRLMLDAECLAACLQAYLFKTVIEGAAANGPRP